ncbi:uncharacterized protein METZ01_LOCUS110659, partial [marine metagenome]
MHEKIINRPFPRLRYLPVFLYPERTNPEAS